MGCLFGGRLAEAGHRVVLVDVRTEQVEAINHDGLRIEDDDGERTIRLSARLANEDPGAPGELVLLLTKAYQSEASLTVAGGIFGPGFHGPWPLAILPFTSMILMLQLRRSLRGAVASQGPERPKRPDRPERQQPTCTPRARRSWKP